MNAVEYRRALRAALQGLRGRDLTQLARDAGVSRALVYRLRARDCPGVRSSTLERLEAALKGRP